MTMPTDDTKLTGWVRSIRAVSSAVHLPETGRAATDACPGALRLHEAADGPLARVRVPGGRLTGAQLASLRALAARWGDGRVELTSRANLQLRALQDASPVTLAESLGAAGLLPSPTHELVRNIAASPLLADPSAIVALDRALCADPALTALPGRFLFAIDDGSGDVAWSADAAALPITEPTAATPPATEPTAAASAGAVRPSQPRPARFAVLLGGRDVGLRIAAEQVVPALLAAAGAFLELADEQAAAGGRRPWRVRELSDGPARLAAATARELGVPLGERDPGLVRPPQREPIGIIERGDGGAVVGALVPLGVLTSVQLRVLERADELVVTPWRGVVVAGLDRASAERWARELAAAGLEVAAGSRWVGVTTCSGLPGCARALADVRGDADASTVAGPGGLPVHWVGCGRGCGSPAGAHVRVEATKAGYRVAESDQVVPVREVAGLVAAAREV